VRIVPTRAGLRPGPHRLRIQDAGRGPPIAARPRARRRQALRTASARSSTPSRTHRSRRLPIVCRGGQVAGSSAQAAPARHSHHSASSMLRVDHSRGRPVLAAGSIASMVLAKRTVAFARMASLMAGA
jgi:hypothetical protein